MDIATAKKLIDATKDFYDAQCESFSQTRQKPWEGWEELLPMVADTRRNQSRDLSILDIGCGNLRFEEHVASSLSEYEITTYAIDSCKPLVELGTPLLNKRFEQLDAELVQAGVKFKQMDAGLVQAGVKFEQMDVIKKLGDGLFLKDVSSFAPKCNLCVTFGFMHHIPIMEWRQELLDSLVEMTVPKGLICVSFWQPGNSEKLLKKLENVTARGCEELAIEFPKNSKDYLLDWQNDKRVYRYVHDFDDAEIDDLVTAACSKGARLAKSYSADGKTGDLNRYVILERDVY